MFYTKNGNPYKTVRLERVWRVASKKANDQYGTKIVNLYNGLKHAFGCQRLDEGYSLEEIRAVMGPTDSQTTRRYAEYANSRLSNVMRGSSSREVYSNEN